MLDHEKQIFEYEKTLQQLKGQNKQTEVWSQEEIIKLEQQLEELKTKVYSDLSAWERVLICRHPDRPKSLDYLQHTFTDFVEIHGDRLYRDDHAIITGFGKVAGRKCVIIAQEKGKDTESRLYRNFGMPYPEGYRKASRAMKLAEKFNLPIVSLIDTPGAFPGLEAEERGQGWAIAHNLWEMARLKTPIIGILIGEGCSGGALGIGVTDVIAMLEHSYYSVISPEGCASILWKDSTQNATAAAALKLHVEDLIELNIVDDKIEEPMGGAHHNPQAVYSLVRDYIAEKIDALSVISIEDLLENRYQKYRKMGRFLEAGVSNTANVE